jgi:hypothetical protein
MAGQDSARTSAVIQTAVRQRRRWESGQSRILALLTMALAGGFGLLLALVLTAGNPNAAPTCDGQAMSPGDTCEIISTNGGGGDYTYQQMINRRDSRHLTWKVAGFCLTGLAVLLVVPVARALDPSKPWGTPVGYPCPRCGQKNLQEKRVTHSRNRGRMTYHSTGIVTLCAAECGFASSRRP